MEISPKLKGSSVFFSLFLLLLQAVPSWASITIDFPATFAVQGQAVTLGVRVDERETGQGYFYYRTSGIDFYQILPLAMVAGKAVVTLPASAVVAPWLEYYVQLTDAFGNTTTSPATNARRIPHRLPVREKLQSTQLRLVLPDTTRPFRGDVLPIVIEVNFLKESFSSSLTLLLDETDISTLAEFGKGKISVSLPLIPEPGQHTLQAVVQSESGKNHSRSWTFEVAAGQGDKKQRQAYARGGISFNYGRQIKSPSGSNGGTLSGNLNLDFGIKGSDWEATWNGVNIQYVKDNPEREVTISPGFHFTLKKGEQFLEYGDISIKEGALVAPSFARRGMQAKLKANGTELRLFDVSAAPASGWNTGLFNDNQQVYGLSVSRSMLPGNRLPINLTFIQGENGIANAVNSAGTQSPSKGDIVGLTLSYNISQVSVSGEFASSRFDADTTDTQAKQSDIAGTTNISTNLGRYSLNVGYHYYGTDFASIANPNFSADRQGFSTSIAAPFGPSNVSLSLNKTSDNVSSDATRPVVSSTSGSLNYGLVKDPWPSLNVSYSKSLQDSDKEPTGSLPVKNSNDAISLSLSKSGEKWNSTLGSNYSRLKDKIGNLTSSTKGLNLSGSYAFSDLFRVSPSFSHTQSEGTGAVKKTSIASISGSMSIYPPYADTSLQFSHTSSDASDGSIDSINQNGSWRLSLNLDKLLKRWTEFGRKSLALSVNYSQIEDRAVPANSRDETSIFLSINFFSPMNTSWGF